VAAIGRRLLAKLKRTPAPRAAPSRRGELLEVASRAQWRAWLAAHHDSATEIWLVFYKVRTGQSRVSYEEAVEEAICYGWVDSLVRRIDELRYCRKFTPRKPASNWSESNRRRLAKLVAEGKTTAAGLAKAPSPEPVPPSPRSSREEAGSGAGKGSGKGTGRGAGGGRAEGGAGGGGARGRGTSAAGPELPGYVERALRQNERAWQHFQKLAPSYRRLYVGWIEAAKREPTRLRRLAEVIGVLEQGKKLGLK
jgi:uncharacterized protein YdeI (YjbR/CyaY-like superfamily)